MTDKADRDAVLVVDDEPASVELLRISLGEEFEVYTATAGEAALEVLAAHPEIAVAVIDQRMPGMTGAELIRRTAEPYPDLVRIILTGYSDIDSLVDAINAGRVYRYLTKPWSVDELLGTVRQGAQVHRLAVENLRLQKELEEANGHLRIENSYLRREAKGRHQFDEIVGNSAALRDALDLVERAAQGESTVLITGETGTGKELVARAIHYNGPRADKPFITENCGAIAPDLLTSELFGHRRGAFTSATEDRKGLFEVADGGTLFLDEIGDCPPELQMRLLRVLDQGEVRRVGDSEARQVNVRIVAATNRNLEDEVESGRFRRDLFYRLSVFTVHLPPLRQRREDVPVLAEHFLRELNRRSKRSVEGFTTDALEVLAAHDYPGNVRELQNEVERAFMLADGESLIAADLLSEKVRAAAPVVLSSNGSLRSATERLEVQMIRDALARCGGNQTRAAADLGLSRRGLISKLQRYRLR